MKNVLIYGIVFLAALFIYSFVTALFSAAGRRRDDVRRRLGALAGDPKEKFTLDEELEQPFADRFIKPLLLSLSALLERVVPKRLKNGEDLRTQNKSRRDAQLRKTLAMAGLTISPANYRLLRAMIILASGVCAVVAGFLCRLQPTYTALLAMFAPLAAYVVIRYVTAAMATGRRQRMERNLPDILDILSISVEAGLGFEQAIGHIVQNMSGDMVDEFAVAYREMSMGRTRREAMMAMAERCDFDELRTFTGAVVQAGQLGISIKNVLRSQSESMRQNRKARAQEKAQKVSTKILFPMLIFIFPVIFVILLGPAAMNILKTLG